jgi:3-methyladenine DNA glycosylase AlkD
MNFAEVMAALEAAGSEQTRKTYRRHGIENEMFGVSYATYGALKKKIKVDHELARQLWATGNHDAQVLATMIADPRLMSPGLLDDWVKSLGSYAITDAFARLAAQAPAAQKKSEKWMDSKNQWTACAGWSMLAQAVSNPELPDAYFEDYLDTIERDIHSRQNRVRYVMNSTLIAIGTRNQKLQKRALAAARKIGRVEVDHGNTSCKTPDATEYILKTAAHLEKKRTAKV